MPWLSVAMRPAGAPSHVTKRWIVDSTGRGVTLRGANFEAEERSLPPPGGMQRPIDPSLYDGMCPNNRGEYQEPPICEVQAGAGKFNQSWNDYAMNDFASARAFGFNIVRLCLSWSDLEPTPGAYSSTYLDRVEQLVSWAAEQDVYVILDMHEDIYSRFILGGNTTGIPPYLVPGDGQDGAPDWAVLMHGFPPLEVLGIADLNIGMMRAFQAFWDNEVGDIPQGSAPGPGLQDHYIGALAALAARFVDNPAIAGYEIINEPQPGLDLDPWDFTSRYLHPFYSRVLQAVTGVRDGLPTCPPTAPSGSDCAYPDLGVHDQHLWFFEPSALRNLFDVDLADHAPFTTYTNIVYAPHVYSYEFTIIQPPSFEYAYQTATAEADGMNAALFVTEFGGGAAESAKYVFPTLDAQDMYQVGGTFWSWKTNCVGQWCVNGSWSVFQPAPSNGTGVIPQTGPARAVERQMLSRVHLRAVSGSLQDYFYNISDGSFAASVTAGAPITSDALTPLRSCPQDRPMSIAEAESCTRTLRSAPLATLTELYVPSHVAGNITVTPGGQLVSVLRWPDSSVSALIAASSAADAALGYNVTVGTPNTMRSPTSLTMPEVGAKHLSSSWSAWVARMEQVCELAAIVEPRILEYCTRWRVAAAERTARMLPP